MTNLDLFDSRVQAKQCYERLRVLLRRYEQHDPSALHDIQSHVQAIAIRANWQVFDLIKRFDIEPNEYALLIQDDHVQVRVAGALLGIDTPISAFIDYRDAGGNWLSGELLEWTVLPGTDDDLLEVFASIILRLGSNLSELPETRTVSQSWGLAISCTEALSEAPAVPGDQV